MKQNVDSQNGTVEILTRGVEGDVEVHIDKIFKTYTRLSQEMDLRPCKCINALFQELVGLCTKVISNSATKKVRRHSGSALHYHMTVDTNLDS